MCASAVIKREGENGRKQRMAFCSLTEDMKSFQMSYVFFVMIFLVSFTRAASPPVVGPTENSTVTLHVGVILDFGSTVDMVRKTCIATAIDDLNAIPGRRIRLVVHWRDSHGSETGAASAALNLIKSIQVKAIIGPHASEQAHLLANMANQAHIPTFSFSAAISSSHSPAKSPYFITMAQNDPAQVRAIAAVVKAYAWRAVILVHDDTLSGISLVPDLTDELQANGARLRRRLVIPFTANEVIIRDTLRKLAAMRTRAIIVHISFPIGGRFFTLVHEMGMMEDGYVWIITSRLMNLLGYMNTSSILSMQGVLGVKTYVPKSSSLDNFRVRWKRQFEKEHPEIEISELDVYALWAYDAMRATATAAESASFGLNRSFNYLPSNSDMAANSNPGDFFGLGASPMGMKFLQAIMGTTFTGLSGVIQFIDGQVQYLNFEIVNVVGKWGRGIGYWTPASGLSRSPIMDKNYSANAEDLAGVIWPGGSTAIPNGLVNTSGPTKKLRIAVPVKNNFGDFMKVDRDQNNQWTWNGFPIDVFNGVMKTLPYSVSYEFIPYENGHENETGYYDELIYQVYLKTFDAAVGDISITSNRTKYVEFTQPYAESGVSMIVPIKYEYGTKSPWWFLKPLSKEVWLTTIALFVFKGILVWIFEHERNPEFQGSLCQQVGKIISFCFSTLVFANREKLESNYSRIVVNLWIVVVLVLVTSFTANLTSILTLQKLQPSTTSLIENREYVGYHKGSDIFESLKAEGFYESKLRAYATRDEYAEALSKGSGKNGVSAIIDEIPYLKVVLKKYCGKYTMAGPTHQTGGFGFVFPRGSAIATDVSLAVLKFAEGNKMISIKTKWFGDEAGCSVPQEAPAVNTDVHLFPLYIVTGGASALTLFVYIMCHAYRRRCQRGGDLKESPPSDDVGPAAQVEKVQEHANKSDTRLGSRERSEDSTSEGVSSTDGERENDQMGPSNCPEAVITLIRVSDIISEEEHHNVGGK